MLWILCQTPCLVVMLCVSDQVFLWNLKSNFRTRNSNTNSHGYGFILDSCSWISMFLLRKLFLNELLSLHNLSIPLMVLILVSHVLLGLNFLLCFPPLMTSYPSPVSDFLPILVFPIIPTFLEYFSPSVSFALHQIVVCFCCFLWSLVGIWIFLN